MFAHLYAYLPCNKKRNKVITNLQNELRCLNSNLPLVFTGDLNCKRIRTVVKTTNKKTHKKQTKYIYKWYYHKSVDHCFTSLYNQIKLKPTRWRC